MAKIKNTLKNANLQKFKKNNEREKEREKSKHLHGNKNLFVNHLQLLFFIWMNKKMLAD